MITIQDAQQFISDYAEMEYRISVGLHDQRLSDEEHKKNIDYLGEHFYPNFYRYTRTSGLNERFTRIETEEKARKRIDKIIKRKVFLIRQYTGAVTGKGIRGLDNDTIFSCFIGQNTVLADHDVYMTNMIVGIIDKELRIISVRHLDSQEFQTNQKIRWSYSNTSFEVEDDIVLRSEGELVDTLRIRNPAHPLWIADYES
jgi:hypothetical protein